MIEDLREKNILITGATGGIGSVIANDFYNYGSNILVTGTNEEKLKKLVSQFQKNVNYAVCDLSKDHCIKDLLEKVKIFFDNKVDVLVNNAGITKDNLAIRMKHDEWAEVINLNLNSTFFLTKEILKLMIKNRKGKIVNISSVVGTSGNLGQANYAASKAGIEAMSKSIALEVAKRGITVNCIAPGFIQTNMTEGILENRKELLLSKIPLEKIGHPNDVSKLVLFLSSKCADYITGQTIHVNGGMIM